MLNVVVLVGRLVKDPEIRYASSGKAVATLRIAVDRNHTNAQGERETDFVDVVVWDRQAENVANHLQKGRLVAVHGRLQIRSWETPEGQRREKAEVVASQVRFLDKAPTNSTGGGMGETFVPDDDDVPF